MRFATAILLVTAILPGTACADPGVGDPVYGATLVAGMTEFEARYGRLTGGTDDGADGLVLEAEHAFSRQFSVATLVELGRDPGSARHVNAISVEAIHTLGRIKPLAIDVALYGEYKAGLRGDPDALEGKLLLQHRRGAFDARVNLIAEHPLRQHEPVEFSYAASADWALVRDDLKLGVAAFGDLGTSFRIGGRQEHFAGPEIKAEIDRFGIGELEIEAGWLKAFGAARDHTDGQSRLLLSYELFF
jgi:hypothetical protein